MTDENKENQNKDNETTPVKTEAPIKLEESPYDSLPLAVAKLRAMAMIKFMDRQKRNFERDFVQVGTATQKIKDKKTGELVVVPVLRHVKDQSGRVVKVPVAVYQRAFYRQGKYTGEKLRQIRNEQTAKAVQGRTHYNDGTLINPSRLVDLAMVN